MCIDENILNETLETLSNMKWKLTKNRPNASGTKCLKQWGRNKGTNKYDKVGYSVCSMNFGMVYRLFRNTGNIHEKLDSPYQEGANNAKYPEVYDSLKKLIHHIDSSFEYNSITINKNFKCRPHYDKNNKSPSMIIGLGDYEGGELVVEKCEMDIKNNPVIFNGGSCLHWVNEFIGDRFTIVYYNI